MPASTEVRRAQARHAAAVRWQKPNKDESARDLAAARIEHYVAQVVAAAPPLTSDQRDRIATLLRPVADGGVAA